MNRATDQTPRFDVEDFFDQDEGGTNKAKTERSVKVLPPILPTLKNRAAGYLTFCRLRAALRHLVHIGMASRVVAIQLGEDDAIPTVHDELTTLCTALDVDISVYDFAYPIRKRDPIMELHELSRLITSPATFVLIPFGARVSDEMAAHFDDYLVLEPPSAAHVRALVHRATGEHAPDTVIERVQRLSVLHLNLAVRAGRPLAALVASLARLEAATVTDAPTDVTQPPTDNAIDDEPEEETSEASTSPPSLNMSITLDDVAGMDEAVAWGHALVEDFRAWRAGEISWAHVDPGVLLAGPPGTGKTMFARALANSTNVHFEAASLASWQATGYLNNMLKAIRESFDIARKKAPAILFIDEIDAAGDRAALKGHNASYDRDVINALLECLDGAARREGLVVIAATNSPEQLDAALLRSGRLDRVIWVMPPDQAARAKILRLYLGSDAALPGFDDAALDDVVAPLVDYTGADIERLVRLSRRRARSQRRDLTVGDLLAECPTPPLLTAEDVRRIAIHEAGHALIAHLNGLQVLSMQITADVMPGGGWRGGFTESRAPDQVVETETLLKARIAILLAGHAAEQVALGDRSSGAGGGDLRAATELAIRIEAQLGLGVSLAQLVGTATFDVAERMSDLQLRTRVDALLRAAYDAVCGQIREYQQTLERLANELVTKRTLDNNEIAGLLAS
jgi:ATP-dependent Zn protease